MTDTKNIFEFTEVGDDMTGIKITDGKYEGVHWTFGTVAFDEEPDEDGKLSCHFDYIMHDYIYNLHLDSITIKKERLYNDLYRLRLRRYL